MASRSARASADGGGVINIVIDKQDEQYYIHRVPRNLREVNEKAYIPQLISIGPYHHGKEELADMEKYKIRYKKEFYGRIIENERKKLRTFIKDHQEKISRCYTKATEFSSDKFVKIILYDTIFIIELFLRFHYEDRSDFSLNEVWLGAIRRDLQLLENQLPYFVLEELYKLASTSATPEELPHFQYSFSTLSRVFFKHSHSHYKPLSMQLREVKIKHFTDLCRYALVQIPLKSKSRGMKLISLPNAVKLKKSGVKFKRRWGTYLVDIILEKRKRPICFSDAVELKIPGIDITYDTECLIRNVMALEQFQYPSETYICHYIDLMDSLINSENDVDLLVEQGIICNFVGDNAVIAGMFNKLCLEIPPSRYSYYSTIYNELGDHYNRRRNHVMETLKSVYFSDPWIGTGTVVAVILLLLTFIQTVFSVLQLFLAK